nr:hypothetical protein [Hansschlegelia quercus]
MRVHAPVEVGSHWECQYEIDWPDGATLRAASGVDALQALQLTFQMIALELYTSPYHEAGELNWPGAGGGYGFSAPKDLRDVLIGDDKRFDG